MTMDMNGSQRISASREAVYAGLNDVEVLRRCIPGCETIEKTSDTEMVAKVTLRIGPVKASFSGKVTLSDFDPPNGYTISGDGSGGLAGFAKGKAKVTLEPDGDATMLHYTVDAEIGGKLAQMGSRLIDSTAKKLASEFFAKFGEIVGAVPDQPHPPEDVPAEKKGWVGRLLGTGTAAFLLVAFGQDICCLASPHHAPVDTAAFSICSSRPVI